MRGAITAGRAGTATGAFWAPRPRACYGATDHAIRVASRIGLPLSALGDALARVRKAAEMGLIRYAHVV